MKATVTATEKECDQIIIAQIGTDCYHTYMIFRMALSSPLASCSLQLCSCVRDFTV